MRPPDDLARATARGRRWKRFAVVSTVAAAGCLAASIAFGALQANGSGSGYATTGSVSIGNPVSSNPCNIGPMSPGDGTISPGHVSSPSEVQCQFSVTYTGSLQAYLGLSVSIAGTHGGVPVRQANGTTPAAAPALYDSTPTGLQMLIKDNQSSPTVYMNSDGAQTNAVAAGTDLGGSPTSGTTATASDLLVSTSAFSSGAQINFTVDYYLPGGLTGNSYQQAASSVTLTVQAVQATGNGSTSGCSVGKTCSSVTWS
jgi:hypothetical protein